MGVGADGRDLGAATGVWPGERNDPDGKWTRKLSDAQGTSSSAAGGALQLQPGMGGRESPPPPISPYEERSPSNVHAQLPSTSSSSSLAPARSSSLRPSAAVTTLRPTSRPMQLEDSSDGSPPNPPTPHRLDISLHSLSDSSGRQGSSGAEDSYFPATPPSPAEALPPPATAPTTVSPPSYAAAVEHGALGGTMASHHQARRGSGRTHQLAMPFWAC